jgi:hypothetical protein
MLVISWPAERLSDTHEASLLRSMFYFVMQHSDYLLMYKKSASWLRFDALQYSSRFQTLIFKQILKHDNLRQIVPSYSKW